MNYWHETVKIGPLAVPRFIGGPLDGITDAPFRWLVRTFSKEELLYSEMRHVSAIANAPFTKTGLHFLPSERPLNFQIGASTPRDIEKACAKIIEQGVDCIDLNIGCPARAVIGAGGGCLMMSKPEQLKLVLRILQQTLTIPFTVKMRAGYKEKNAITIAQIAQEYGAAAITIHPRLRDEFFAGRPDYALAAQVKQAVSIPVFLSGNIINWNTALMAYNQTGVDGFMIGRGMWSKPWKLAELRAHSRGEQFAITRPQIIRCALEHLANLVTYYGPRGVFCFRKHMPFYLRGFSDAAHIRQYVMQLTEYEAVRDHLERLEEREATV
jgi:tRNA-dihydrouridine synthase B